MGTKHKEKSNIIIRMLNFFRELHIQRTNDFSNLKPIFIVGCGHSGTTILLRILGNHKDLFAINHESKAFQGNYPKVSYVLEWNQRTIEENKKRWVEKTPKHIRHIGRLLKIFPQARIIVMQRDGRDVTVSIRQRFGSSDEAMRRWIDDNNLSVKYLSDPRVMAVKLEDFTNDPEQSLKSICDHLGIDYTKDLLHYKENKFNYANKDPIKTDKRTGEDHLMNRVWQVNQPIFKDTSKWKSLATEEELKMFDTNSSFKKVMKCLKYL